MGRDEMKTSELLYVTALLMVLVFLKVVRTIIGGINWLFVCRSQLGCAQTD